MVRRYADSNRELYTTTCFPFHQQSGPARSSNSTRIHSFNSFEALSCSSSDSQMFRAVAPSPTSAMCTTAIPQPRVVAGGSIPGVWQRRREVRQVPRGPSVRLLDVLLELGPLDPPLPDDELAVVEAGVITGDVDRAAAEYRLRYAPDPASADFSHDRNGAGIDPRSAELRRNEEARGWIAQ
jgi:hypothetical protein